MKNTQGWNGNAINKTANFAGSVLKWAFLVVGISAISIAIFLSVLGVQIYRFWIQSPSENAVLVSFTVERGEQLSEIATGLYEQKLVASPFWFKVFVYGSGQAKSLQSGVFLLSPNMNYGDITRLLADSASGDITLTIPEGYTLKQIGELVKQKFSVSEDEWTKAVDSESALEQNQFIIASQKPDSVDLEGYLFPETYRFYPDASAGEIADRMIDEMEKVYEETFHKYEREILFYPYSYQLTTHNVLTLASIVEREVANPSDMAMVADIFLKRLRDGIALQSDATINYIIDGDSPSPSFQDLEVESAYNTYKYPGLPPGPISNPGLKAIEAVISSQANPYYYFLTTEDGEVIYAKTFEEHLANKMKYLQ